MNLLSPTMGDLISIPSQDMIIGLYIQNDQKSPRHYGNWENPLKSCSYRSKVSSKKEPYFYIYDNVVGVWEWQNISLRSPLWFQWGTNMWVITSRNCEKSIEVQYDPLGISFQIHEHYHLEEINKNFFSSIYVCTTIVHVIFNQQIEEAI